MKAHYDIILILLFGRRELFKAPQQGLEPFHLGGNFFDAVERSFPRGDVVLRPLNDALL